jgi:hypothetical protein
VSILPYRGVSSVACTPSGDAAPEPVRAAPVLRHPDTPEDLREAGLAAASPLGVAALWIAYLGSDPCGPQLAPSVGEHWIARHGPVFAARTAAEFAALGVVPQGLLIRLWDTGSAHTADLTRPALTPVRAALADAPDASASEILNDLESRT